METKSYKGPRKVYSEEFKQDVLGRIKSGEFSSAYHASVVLGLQQCTVLDWIKKFSVTQLPCKISLANPRHQLYPVNLAQITSKSSDSVKF